MKLLTILFLTFSIIARSQSNNCPAFCLPNTSNFPYTPSGVGVQELNISNRGCMSIEHQSVWLSVTIQTSGILVFRVNPNNNPDDFDFAVWGPSSPCPPITSPIRCSWAAGGGNTGLGNGATDFSEGAGGDRWVAPLNVLAGETYIILIDNFSVNSGFVLNFNFGSNNTTATFTCTTLPIELISFSGKIINNQVELTWISASESNNDYYIIDKSEDAIHWSKLTEVDGAGNSNYQLIYSIVDFDLPNDISYYKLTQVDFNGVSEEFEIIAVQSKNTKPVIISSVDILGRPIDSSYTGLVIEYYSDGSIRKVFKQSID